VVLYAGCSAAAGVDFTPLYSETTQIGAGVVVHPRRPFYRATLLARYGASVFSVGILAFMCTLMPRKNCLTVTLGHGHLLPQ